MGESVLRFDGVFEGGGAKGIGLVGALSVLEARGYRPMNLAGTSAGAIVATLLAAGYTSAELKKILFEVDFSSFQDQSFPYTVPVLGPFLALLLRRGLYRGQYFEKWMGGLLEAKGIRTFKDLVIPELKDDPKYRYKLQVIAADVTRGQLLVLPRDARELGLDPDAMPVARAVRMSMSIPFFFEPVKAGRSTIVDGGLLSNYPMWLLTDEGRGLPSWPTFGFKLVEPGEGRPRRTGSVLELLGALVSTMLEAHDSRYIEEHDFTRTIPIRTLGVGTTEFDLSEKRKAELFESGARAAEKFLASWDWQAYLSDYRAAGPRTDSQAA
jgi:NTE family protein